MQAVVKFQQPRDFEIPARSSGQVPRADRTRAVYQLCSPGFARIRALMPELNSPVANSGASRSHMTRSMQACISWTTAQTVAIPRENTVMIRTSALQAESEPASGGRCTRLSLAVAGMAFAALVSLAGCSSSIKVGPDAVAGLTPDGTVDMEQVQVAYIGSGSGGNGTLYYRGNAYPFNIGGLGVGGIGASTISAAGEVYKLSNVANFAGSY